MKTAVLLLSALIVVCSAGARTCVHPGIDVSQADIDRARAFVAEGREPWASSFAALKASPYSSLEAPVFDRGTSLVGANCNGTIGMDGRRAHDLALLYRLTDDVRYAEKAAAFLNANSHYETLDSRGTAPLDNGLFYRARHRSGRWQSLAPNMDKPEFGGPGAPREAAYAHYLHDAKLPPDQLAWLKKAIDQENAKNGGFETWGKAPNWQYEWSGWGTLMKRRL